MELLQLKYFQTAARKENITHAAQEYMVPPSSVSAAIKKLENELGVKLFTRTANKLSLNEYGRIFLRAVETADNELNKAKIEMLNLSTVPSGEIKMLILTNRRTVTNIISNFKKQYPNVSFNIKHENYNDYGNYSKFDIIISDQNISSGSFIKNLFVNEEIFLAVHKDNILSDMTNVSVKDIKNQKFIGMSKGCCLREYMDDFFSKNNFNPEYVIECDDPYYIREYVKMGLGVTFFPEISWGGQKDENIKLIKINNGLYRDSFIYLNKDSSETAKIFVDNLIIF